MKDNKGTTKLTSTEKRKNDFRLFNSFERQFTGRHPRECHHDKIQYGVNTCYHRYVRSKEQAENPAGIYLLKVNNRNTRTRREICSKLTIKKPERRY